MDRDQITVEPACLGQITDLADLAADLAGFLAALYAIDASGGLPPGRHNWFRGGSLATWDEQTRTCLDRLAALWKALITLGGEHGGDGGQAAARQFGWRYSPREVISRVIADHVRA